MAQDNLVQEVHCLQATIVRLEKEKKERELDEPIGTIAGCLTILLFAFLAGVLWSVDALLLKGSLWSLIQAYSTESFLGGTMVAILGTIAFFITAIFMLISVDNFFRGENAV